MSYWDPGWLDRPMQYSRRRRFGAWLKRRPLKPMTPREAQRLVNEHMAQHAEYVTKKSPPV